VVDGEGDTLGDKLFVADGLSLGLWLGIGDGKRLGIEVGFLVPLLLIFF
jgi:hypothetical protein